MRARMRPSRTRTPLSPRHALLATLLVLADACDSAKELPSSQTLTKLGQFSYSSARDPKTMSPEAHRKLAKLRHEALREAALVLDRHQAWTSAEPEVRALYDNPRYRADYGAQQLIAIAFIRGALLPAPKSTARDRALYTHVRHLVLNGGIDSVSIYTGLSDVSPAVDTAKLTEVRTLAAVNRSR